MEKNERATIAAVLETADDATIKEVIREAESFLSDQLKSALSADSRAMTFAGILAAITSFLVGSSANLISSRALVWPYSAPVGLIVAFLLLGLFFAIRAARPTAFEYSGNSPKYWVKDVETQKSLVSSLASQAAIYASDIEKNDAYMAENHKNLGRALWCAFGGVAAGALLELALLSCYFFPACAARFL